MDEIEDKGAQTRRTGCAQAAVIGALLLWLGAIPAGVVFLTDRALGKTVAPGVMAAVVIVVSAVILLLPFVSVALLTRRQAGWKATATTAAGLAAVAGCLLLDAAIRAVLTPTPALPLQGEGGWLAVLRLGVLVPYVLLAVWLAPRLAGAAPRRVREWLGLDRFVGDDGADNRTGVAPDAQWIGCRNMRRNFGNPGSYAECMEFFLAPYPHGGDPFTDGDVTLAPHVVNNSWGCPDIEGCFPDTLAPAVEALRAAGMMMVVSVGNDGPACGTATTPPANYDGVFSVGAATDAGAIVGFSSRGPVGELIKPDVTAPGDYVRSSVPGGGYGWAGGTSMAGPHVTGLVALLWSADSTLIGDMDATEALICQTAVPRPVENVCTTGDEVPEGALASLLYNPICACGDVTGVPNNVYGCGFIDAGAAVRAALGQ